MPNAPILSRKSAHRSSMLRNLATSVILYETVDTTLAKAKAVRGLVERWITLALPGTVQARRSVLKTIQDPKAARKIFDVLIQRYASRHGGYTRIIRIGTRLGDAAPMVKLELVDSNIVTSETKVPDDTNAINSSKTKPRSQKMSVKNDK